MRTLLFLALTCFVSSFGYLGNLGNHHHRMLPFIILYGAWLPFIFYYRSRHRRITARKRRAYLQEQCMRTYLQQHRHRY